MMNKVDNTDVRKLANPTTSLLRFNKMKAISDMNSLERHDKT